MKLDNCLRGGGGIGRIVHVRPNAMALAATADNQKVAIIRSNGRAYIQSHSPPIASIAAVSKARQTLVSIVAAGDSSEGDR